MPKMSYGELERLQAAAIQAETSRDFFTREIRKDEEALAIKKASLRRAIAEHERLRGVINAETAPDLTDLSAPDPASKAPIPRGSAGDDDIPAMPPITTRT